MVIQLLALAGVILISRWRPAGGPLAAAPVSLLLLLAFALHQLLPPAWIRAPLAPLVWLVPPALGLAWALRRSPAGERTLPTRQALRTGLIEVAFALALALAIGLRPHLFEYPGDSVSYLRDTLSAGLHRSSVNFHEGLCRPREWFTYAYNCRLWFQMAGEGPPLGSLPLFGSASQLRLPVVLELLVFGLAYQRLLARAGMGGWRSGACLVLVVAGLGNYSIALGANHVLQGLLLGLVVLMEAAAVLLWYVSALAGGAPGARRRPLWGVHATFLAVVLLQLFVALRLHGAVALLILIMLVPTLGLLGLGGLGRRNLLGLAGLDCDLMVAASAGLFALLAVGRSHALVEPSTWSQTFRWGGTLNQMISGQPLATYLSGSSLAIVSWLVATALLLGRAPGPRSAAAAPCGPEPRTVWLWVMAVYCVAIALVLTLPPLSNLFLVLNTDDSSHYRLLWGAVLLSPLPPLLFDGGILRKIGAALVAALVLLPSPQTQAPPPLPLSSKTRHLLSPAASAADVETVLLQVPPLLKRIESATAADPSESNRAARRIGVRPLPMLLADPIVSYALEPLLSGTYRLSTSRRLLHHREFRPAARPDRGLSRTEPGTLASILAEQHPSTRPAVIVQQRPEACRFSAYVDAGAYDPCLASEISRRYVNAIPAATLRALGYRPLTSADGRFTAWYRSAA